MGHNSEKKPIGATPATNVNNGQDPDNTREDSERKEERSHEIPASPEEYNNPSKAAQERKADVHLSRDGNDDLDIADQNSLKGQME